MAVASIPGLLLMGLVVATLARALRSADDLDTGSLLVRRPMPSRLVEQRFVNVVGEMAIAASIAEPRVLVTERATRNAVVLGADDATSPSSSRAACWSCSTATRCRASPRTSSRPSPTATCAPGRGSHCRWGCSA